MPARSPSDLDVRRLCSDIDRLLVRTRTVPTSTQKPTKARENGKRKAVLR